MKRKLKKRITAFLLCLILVVCNSVSIFADELATTAAESVNTEKQEKERKEEKAPEATTAKKEETTKEKVPETTTAKKEETTTEKAPEATTEKKEETASILSFQNEEVTIEVTADDPAALPKGVELKVVPVTAENTLTQEQYIEVEKEVKDKAAEENKEIKGMLAYDISLVDTEGNEVEPSGKVTVSMYYKNAAQPLSDEEKNPAAVTEVSVLHLEEDENGLVKEVVDLGEQETTKLDVLDTAEGKKIQAVEMETESFSVFTIVWTDTKEKITIHYVNKKYQEITGKNLQQEEVIPAQEKPLNLCTYGQEIDGYHFSNEVTIGKEDGSVPIQYVRYTPEEGLSYGTQDGEQIKWTPWDPAKGYHVYLIYEPVSWGDSGAAVIETMDNNSRHITMNLFDYHLFKDGKETEYSKYNLNSGKYTNETGINQYSKFRFTDGWAPDEPGCGDPVDPLNRWTGSDYWADWPRQDIVNNKLSNGYPVLTQGNGGVSLSYLFDNQDRNGKTTYPKVNGLLTQDQDGYYSFDSDMNYAKFNKETKSFTVYDEGLGMFYPFNALAEVKEKMNASGNTKPGVSDGNQFGRRFSGGWGFYWDSGINHYFGLTMSTTFYQPKGGTINGKDMVFEFSGDDDVWVFIDDTLVLDLGGIHDASRGSINFRTGEVVINGNSQTPNLFDRLDVSEFKNYSTHSLKFYYLERGNNVSNCKLRFNLPTIPENAVMVTKEVEDQSGNTVDYAEDIEYKFNIVNKKQQGKKQYNYDLYENNVVIKKDLQTDEHGNFTLKHGQSAVIKGFSPEDEYVVKETGAFLGDGYEIKINDTVIEVKNEAGQEVDHIYSAETDPLSVSKESSTVFTNTVQKLGTLILRKELDGGKDEAEKAKEFSIRLKINGKPYEGSYTLKGEAPPEDKKANKGIIYLKADQQAEIIGFPYGTKFEVEEILDDGYLPTYSIEETEGGLYECRIPGKGTDDKAVTGSIAAGGTVKVTNKKITQLAVEKKWIGGEETSRPGSVTVELVQDNKPTGKKEVLSADNEWKTVFKDLDYYGKGDDGKYYIHQYTVKETKIGDAEVNSTGQTSGWQSSVSEAEDGKAIVTNTAVTPWKIEKISENTSSDGTKLPLEGTEFTATTEEGSTYYGKSGANGDILWYQDSGITIPLLNLPYGKTYTVMETKAPSGYIKYEGSWIVDLTDKRPVITGLTPSEEEGVQTWYFTNKPLYALPSAGGSGIFTYTIGGTMLLMAAALILYRMKKKEVQGK